MEDGIHRSLGLTDDEYAAIERIVGRAPNHLELAMYAVMWSEHCSYKSSRIHLKRLPTEAPWVLVGPGENAGVVDVGDGIAAAIRIESHNHPSAIEPYQGAATGVGGILRDIFTMGARPIALMDPLRFGPLDDARSRWIAEGVVSGVSGYGNSVGVPNVGGETVFDETYKGNPLVNVLCLGLLPTERLVLGQATGVGNLAVLLGSTTGRDGIGGVSVLASAGFSDEESDAEKRPSVQVGDPFEEKRLIEACLELLDAGLVVGIQDLGGAGLTCATSETASRGGMGMDVDVTAVPLREQGMEPFETMTSESQERMLAIVEPADLDRVLEICERWEVRASVIGKVTPGPATGDPDGGRLRILDGWEGDVLADIPAASLHEDAPLYDRPCVCPTNFDEVTRVSAVDAEPMPASADAGAELLDLLGDSRWVWSQYDHQLFLNTVEGPGGDAAVLRLKHPATGADTGRGLALTTDGNHRWCAVDPRQGTALTVAESVMNLACVGARPLAVVNCLNFGNPEHAEVMWQLSESIDGMAEACKAFDVPVIGGNVSLYNEAQGANIDPTPVIGLLGVVDRLDRRPPGVGLVDGGRLILIGVTQPELSGSRWARARGHRGGKLPGLDHAHHLAVADVVRTLVAGGLLAGAHDVSGGGLGLALAEMAVRSGLGVNVARVADAAELFSESPSRVVVCVAPDDVTTVLNVCEQAGVPTSRIGVAGGDRIAVKGLLDIALAEAEATWANRLPDALGAGTTQG
ncbi:phosphoribosylformylglycinamidine synthase subunit PurL [Rhabdothermincola salaria]|uniref:phosphoribosylformylglycinamidine synthase subunit PurL n=1 Tax=Rhabdothermincola salaria TaxID=2903142 RepID=UPI001E56CE3E|nr:phosphoribosylformylglycinamidine synthase subunit PurL [Rhabdothermincola salaria]MCD9624566.1 phosphoribosylformylglycinamidine synthase subunit PurL [Rhabdothermincola salaria]